MKDLTGKLVLGTGAAVSGSFLCRWLVKADHEVLGVDNEFAARRSNLEHLSSDGRFELSRQCGNCWWSWNASVGARSRMRSRPRRPGRDPPVLIADARRARAELGLDFPLSVSSERIVETAWAWRWLDVHARAF